MHVYIHVWICVFIIILHNILSSSLNVVAMHSVPGPATLEKFSMRPASGAMHGGVVVEGQLRCVCVCVCMCVRVCAS